MKGDKGRSSADGGRLGRELFGLFAIFCGLLFILSLATFDSRDPWLNHVVSSVGKIHNKAGLFGAYLAGLLYDIFGLASWTLPAFLCIAGARRIMGVPEWPWWRWIGFLLIGFCISLAGAAGDAGHVDLFNRGRMLQGAGNVSIHGGGIIGQMLYGAIAGWMGPTGALLVWLFSLLLAMQMLTGISWVALLTIVAYGLWNGLQRWGHSVRETISQRRAEQKEAHLRMAQNPSLQPALTVTAIPKQEPGDKEAIPSLPLESQQGTGEIPQPQRAEPQEKVQLIKDLFRPAQLPAQQEEEAVEPAPSDSLVHPLVPRPHIPDQQVSGADVQPLAHTSQKQRSEETPLKDLFHMPFKDAESAGRFDEDDDLPPILRDFEEGRVGVSQAGSAVLKEDKDLLDILWGAEEKREAPAASEPGYMNQQGRQGHAAPSDISGASIPFAGEEQETDEGDLSGPPLLSARTAAAVLALRAAGAEEDFSSISRSASAPLSGLSRNEEETHSLPGFLEAVQEDGTLPTEKSDESVLSVHNTAEPEEKSDIPIFEAPPIQAAASPEAPGIAASLMRRIKKPARASLPSLDLLEAVPASTGGTPREALEAKGRSLMTCLSDFGIQGELVGIIPGPVVTMFEVRPAPGVRVSRIANLSDDLALALKAVAVRIQAPVPGTDTVGIEIPNEVRETVCLKELLGSKLFRESKSLLTLVLGKDIAGLPAVADLAAMPHLLVAGATGAGKSVGINSIILSLIYKARPEEVKLLLVDPKRVEMAIYSDLPHLVHPVVTEMQLAKNALEWAVSEMEERYNQIAKAGVRNIADYNAKVASWGQSPPEGMEGLEFMPYLVVIIDELADLMLVAAKEVETSIVRLAQLARAAGIHLILATQRPSVDVVTGLIKANFPCRISFQVTSKHDSRTILDTVGAEHLLGKGDMLFKPGGGKFKRMHGAFVSDNNVNSVVQYWKSQQRPDYSIDFADWAPEGASSGGVLGGGGNGDVAGDPLYGEAVEFVRQQGKASISLIQRKFRIGFNKAARFVEQMELDGIIGPADGSKPRLVIR